MPAIRWRAQTGLRSAGNLAEPAEPEAGAATRIESKRTLDAQRGCLEHAGRAQRLFRGARREGEHVEVVLLPIAERERRGSRNPLARCSHEADEDHLETYRRATVGVNQLSVRMES